MNISLVYLPDKGLALKLKKNYNDPARYYTESDEYFQSDKQQEIDLSDFISRFRYSNRGWYSNENVIRKENEAALTLVDACQIVSTSAERGILVLKIIDLEYRKVLEEHKKSAEDRIRKYEQELKNAQASAKRSATMAARKNKTVPSGKTVMPQKPEPVYCPDPDKPENWVVSVVITRNIRESKSACLCKPDPCRHMLAAVEFFCREERKLREAYIRSSQPVDKSLFISSDLEDLICQCSEADQGDVPPERVKLLRKTVAAINEIRSPAYFDAVMNYIIASRAGGWDGYDARLLEFYSALICAFYMDPWIREQMGEPDTLDRYLPGCYDRQDKSNIVTFKRELKHYQTAEKELNKGKGEDSLYKQIMVKCSGNAEKLLQYFSDKIQEFYDDDLKFIEFHLEEYKQASLDVRSRILEKADRAHDKFREERDRIIPKLLKTFPPNEQAVMLSRMKNYHLDLKTYRNLSGELQKQLAENMQPDTETLRYIMNTVTADYDDRRKAALILKLAEKLEPGRARHTEGEILSDAAEKLGNHALLSLYLKNRYSLVKLQNAPKIQICDADVTDYFRPDFQVKDENGKVRTDYYVYAAGEQPEAEENSNRNEAKALLHFYETAGKLCNSSFPETYLSADSVNRIKALAMAGRQDESERKRQEMQEVIDARKFAMDHEVFASNYKSLCTDLQGEKVVLADSFKVNLSYLFDLSDGKILLSFKVGNTRDYIVKNANDFISAFRNGETVTYGKDLVLTHDIDNLREEDRPVMRLLSPLRFGVSGSGPTAKRYLPISGSLFSNVIELLKGRTVWVGDEPARVRLDPVEVKIGVNDNYELNVYYDPARQKIISSGTRGYIYTCEPNGTSAIDCIRADTDQLRLLEFAIENGGVSIYPILNDFKRNIYSRFYDSFQVADSVKNDFKLSVVRINAYFDYADKVITLRTEYMKDEKEIPRSVLSERMDVMKAESFESAMAGLGFEGDVLRDEGGILSFLKMDFTNLKRLASIYLSDALSSKKLVSLNRQVFRVSYSKTGLIDAVLEKSDFSEEELEEMLRAMKKKRKFILLSGDRIIDLDSTEAKEFRDTVKDLGMEAGKLYKKKRLDMVEALKAFAHENSCAIDRQLRSIVDEIRTFKDYEVKVPKLSYEMRGYQEEGFRWLSVLSKYNLGGILADDMGLGKTLQIIALIKADRTKKPGLIVCPKSLVFNWINEFARFDGETPVTEIYGLPDKRAEIIKSIDYSAKKVYVTSYDSLRNDIEYYDGVFNYCVLDEAQYIKNVTALKSRSVKEIRADHRFALTGTPIENNIIDLWSIFDFIMPGYFEELSEFKSSAGQEEFHAQVAKRIGPFVLRRVKENVLDDLPPKYETILSCEMTGTQRKAYEAVRKKARDAMAASGKAFDLLPMLMQMRQVCVDPAMCVDGYSGGSGKMQMLEELVPRYLSEGHRILMFSQFVKGLNQVEKLLREKGIGYYLLTGETPAKERSRMIDEFNSTTGTDVFLISLKAGGTGLNLTGADTVIHLDPWWNVAAENQATDRAHRIGQTRNVEVIKLISENSIEQRVIELQNLKKDLIDRVISNDESSVTGATLEDIAYILN